MQRAAASNRQYSFVWDKSGEPCRGTELPAKIGAEQARVTG
jgi:hypothetical protein